jgi:hypothetical protein
VKGLPVPLGMLDVGRRTRSSRAPRTKSASTSKRSPVRREYRVQAHTRLLERAQEWQRRDRDASLLLRGDDLRDAERWRPGRPARARRRRRFRGSRPGRAASRSQRFALGAVLVAIVVARLLAVFAWLQRRPRDHHGWSLARACDALALDAVDEKATPEAQDALRVALGTSGEVGRAVGFASSGASTRVTRGRSTRPRLMGPQGSKD